MNWLCHHVCRLSILWVSRLQTEIALSTTEAEYIVLLQAMQDLIPFMTLVEDVLAILKIEYTVPKVQYKNSKMLLTAAVYEDNRGAIELAKMPKLRPCTKHIALKYHHFCEHIRNGKVHIHAIDAREQLADIYLQRPCHVKLSNTYIIRYADGETAIAYHKGV